MVAKQTRFVSKVRFEHVSRMSRKSEDLRVEYWGKDLVSGFASTRFPFPIWKRETGKRAERGASVNLNRVCDHYRQRYLAGRSSGPPS